MRRLGLAAPYFSPCLTPESEMDPHVGYQDQDWPLDHPLSTRAAASTPEHIPTDAVDAAARAMYEDATAGAFVPSWTDLPPDVQRWYRLRAQAALTAAAPLLRSPAA